MTQTIEQLAARVRELEEENARLKRTNSSYANLTKAKESQLTNLRQRLYQLKGADSAIDSERQANCELTEQLDAMTRQRDLAVYGLNEAEVYLTYCKPIEAMREIRKALSAIKESEAK